MKTIYEDDAVKVSIHRREGRNACICFAGIGLGTLGLASQKEEFTKIDGFGVIFFVLDKQRSWGNYLDFDKIRNLITPHIKGMKLYVLGNSMGGFLAVVSTSYFKVDACAAIVPQYSVSRDVIPGEDRWREYVDRIEHFKYPSLSGHFHRRTIYHLFFGDNEQEARHWKRIPAAGHIRKYVIIGEGHAIAQLFKARGLLYTIISQCFSGGRVRDTLASAGIDCKSLPRRAKLEVLSGSLRKACLAVKVWRLNRRAKRI